MSSNVPSKPNLVVTDLDTVAAISALGLVAARSLQANGIVTLMVGSNGAIEIVPSGELELDSMSIDSALQALIERGYTDKQLEQYLLQRDTRTATRL